MNLADKLNFIDYNIIYIITLFLYNKIIYLLINLTIIFKYIYNN